MNTKQMIILPVVGKPYIASDKDGNSPRDRIEVVGGYYEAVDPDRVMIHPLFKNEEPRWNALDIVKSKLDKNHYEIIVNGNGVNTEAPNMAVLYTGEDNVRPLFGIVAIIAIRRRLEDIGIRHHIPTKEFMEDEFMEYSDESDDESDNKQN